MKLHSSLLVSTVLLAGCTPVQMDQRTPVDLALDAGQSRTLVVEWVLTHDDSVDCNEYAITSGMYPDASLDGLAITHAEDDEVVDAGDPVQPYIGLPGPIIRFEMDAGGACVASDAYVFTSVEALQTTVELNLGAFAATSRNRNFSVDITTAWTE